MTLVGHLKKSAVTAGTVLGRHARQTGKVRPHTVGRPSFRAAQGLVLSRNNLGQPQAFRTNTGNLSVLIDSLQHCTRLGRVLKHPAESDHEEHDCPSGLWEGLSIAEQLSRRGSYGTKRSFVTGVFGQPGRAVGA